MRRIVLAILLYFPFSCLYADDAGLYLKDAFEQYSYRHYEKAVKNLKWVIQLDPQNWKAYQLMGYCDYQLKNNDTALAACRESLRLHPENPRLKSFVDRLSALAAGNPPGKIEEVVGLPEGNEEWEMPYPPDEAAEREAQAADAAVARDGTGNGFLRRVRFQLGPGLDILGQSFNTRHHVAFLGGEFSLGLVLDEHWSFWLRENLFFSPGNYSPYLVDMEYPAELFGSVLSARYNFGGKFLKPYVTAGFGNVNIAAESTRVFNIDYVGFNDGNYGLAPMIQGSLGLEMSLDPVVSLFLEGKGNFIFGSYTNQGLYYKPGTTTSFTAADYPVNAGVILNFWGGAQPAAAESRPAGAETLFIKGGLGTYLYQFIFLHYPKRHVINGIHPNIYETFYGPADWAGSAAVGIDCPGHISYFISGDWMPRDAAYHLNVQYAFPLLDWLKPYFYFGLGVDFSEHSSIGPSGQFAVGTDYELTQGVNVFIEGKATVAVGARLFRADPHNDLIWWDIYCPVLTGIKLTL